MEKVGLFVFLQIFMTERLLVCLSDSSWGSCLCLFISMTFDPALGWPVRST